jgi:single stranded DNA-binding protein
VKGIESAFWGVLGKDPELREGKSGKQYCNFGCGVTVEGEATQWINVICFAPIAETISKTAKKGDRIYVEGSLTLATWQNSDGETKTGLAVSAWKVERLGNIGRNRIEPPSPSLPIALPAQKKRKSSFGLFRKAKVKKTPSAEPDPEFNDPIPF